MNLSCERSIHAVANDFRSRDGRGSGALSTAWGAALFEETVAVKIPRGVSVRAA